MRHLLTLILLTTAPAAFAHGGHAGHGVLLDGLLHPLLGLDHLLAALAVGLWAGRQSGATRMSSPLAFILAFVLAMLLAALTGQHMALTEGVIALIEPGIAASLLALALLLALPSAMPPMLALAVLPLLAAAHGLAHGIEGTGSGLYLAGLGLGTLALHVTGLLLAQRLSPRLVQAFSLLMAFTGIMALA